MKDSQGAPTHEGDWHGLGAIIALWEGRSERNAKEGIKFIIREGVRAFRKTSWKQRHTM